MIIGSSLLATTMTPTFSHKDDCLVFAAGISNSQCIDPKNLQEKPKKLYQAVKLHHGVRLLSILALAAVMTWKNRYSIYPT